MIGLLVTLAIVCLIAYVVWWGGSTILAKLALPDPIGTVLFVVLVLIVCLILIGGLAPLAGVRLF